MGWVLTGLGTATDTSLVDFISATGICWYLAVDGLPIQDLDWKDYGFIIGLRTATVSLPKTNLKTN